MIYKIILLLLLFHNITVLLYCWSNKCSFGEHLKKNHPNHKLLNGSVNALQNIKI